MTQADKQVTLDHLENPILFHPHRLTAITSPQLTILFASSPRG
jgi:hypothetical protein